MKDFYLNLGLTIPFQAYSTIRVDVGITETKLENESDEELFNRTTKKVKELFEAELSLQYGRILKIKDKIGLSQYLESLTKDLSNVDNPYVKAFLEEVKKERAKEN
jgi:hypothetical protein